MRSLFSSSKLKKAIARLKVKYMNIENSDRFFKTKIPSRYEISAHDPNFEQKIEVARRGIQKYRNALSELAK